MGESEPSGYAESCRTGDEAGMGPILAQPERCEIALTANAGLRVGAVSLAIPAKTGGFRSSATIIAMGQIAAFGDDMRRERPLCVPIKITAANFRRYFRAGRHHAWKHHAWKAVSRCADQRKSSIKAPGSIRDQGRRLLSAKRLRDDVIRR
jgi:hypothetical protein